MHIYTLVFGVLKAIYDSSTIYVFEYVQELPKKELKKRYGY